MTQDNKVLREALQFYADQQHFVLHEDVFDTISGEPQNWQEDESNTIMFEDGTVAKQALDATASIEPEVASATVSTAEFNNLLYSVGRMFRSGSAEQLIEAGDVLVAHIDAHCAQQVAAAVDATMKKAAEARNGAIVGASIPYNDFLAYEATANSILRRAEAAEKERDDLRAQLAARTKALTIYAEDRDAIAQRCGELMTQLARIEPAEPVGYFISVKYHDNSTAFVHSRKELTDAVPLYAASQPRIEASEPVVWVPVHPRNGPLWMNAITSMDQDRPSYPLMPLYAAPPQIAQPAPSIPDGWQPITAPGQVKVGTKLRFTIGDEKFSETARLILHPGAADEEIIYNRRQNYYLITSMAIGNRGSSKNVEFLAAAPKQNDGGE